jgi:hypothetical protein
MAVERVWDVSRAIDVLDNFSEIDTKRPDGKYQAKPAAHGIKPMEA